MSSEHGVADEVELQRMVEEGKLGEDGKGQFWCGFCCGVVVQEEESEDGDGDGKGAWQARLKHVGDHFDREGLSIDEWVCVVENRKKKYIIGREMAMGRKQRRRKGGVVDQGAESELPGWSPELGGSDVDGVR
jgi:hypothetical protein